MGMCKILFFLFALFIALSAATDELNHEEVKINGQKNNFVKFAVNAPSPTNTLKRAQTFVTSKLRSIISRKKFVGDYGGENQNEPIIKRTMEKVSPTNTFVETLTQTMDKCKSKAKHSKTLCEKSKFWLSTRGNRKYSNCHHSALAIYIHTTGEDCDACCVNTGKDFLIDPELEGKAISDFIFQIEKKNVDSMCIVEMDQHGEGASHFFTLELREKETAKGFYLYSSWANRFSLDWFLGLKKNMRSEMPKKFQKFDSKDSIIETLREKCGQEKFIEFEKLEICVHYLLLIFENQKEIGTEFYFSCKTLNTYFGNLKHETKYQNALNY